MKSKWCAKINGLFNNLGLSFIWDIDGIILKPNHFKTAIKQRSNDIALQEWKANINENSLCINYKIFKTKFEFEDYLLLEDQFRIPLTKFRCGSHQLPISNKRFDSIDERNVCPICHLDTGDEFHYILVCPGFEAQRSTYISPCFYNRPNAVKFEKLFALTSKIKLRKLSKFIIFILHCFRPDNT